MPRKKTDDATYVPPEKFVEIWQTSTSISECADRLGMSKQGAHQRANNYRKKGIPLKAYQGRGLKKLDVDALSKLAKKFAKEK